MSSLIPADKTIPHGVLTVTALNQAVSRMLERSFPLSWVSGEISNFTRAASGHWYFTLKDDGAQVRAVMFRGRAQYADFNPREGDKVEVRALVTLYAPRGDYQLNVEAIRRAGIGNLYEAFLQLKEKLTAEGLFDPARKRTIPAFVRTIGIVTSPQAAALRDIVTTLKRRAPHVQLILYPTPVQGEGSATKIAQAIATASARNECEVLLVCRGGGSIEDLWSFNHELVARTIVGCDIPVIVGVGHETDFTIADFAADLRAPTPTAAAELAATPKDDWVAELSGRARDMQRIAYRRLGLHMQTLDWLARRLVSPTAYIRHERLKLQGMQEKLKHATRIPITQAKFALTQARNRWQAQLPDTTARQLQLNHTRSRLDGLISRHISKQGQSLAALAAQLEMLNPQRTLERGYAIVTDRSGKVIRTPTALKPRHPVTIRLADGAAEIDIASAQQILQ